MEQCWTDTENAEINHFLQGKLRVHDLHLLKDPYRVKEQQL